MIELEQDELAERLEWAEVPPRYRSCRFENFNAYNAKLARKMDIVKKLVSERRGMFLFGPVGSGKTHLAISALAEYIIAGARCKFLGAADFVCGVQGAYGNPKEIVRELLDYRVVLIDDLGAERATESSRAALLYLVDQLYGARKKFIVTSNQTPAEIHAFEPRIMSRLTEICTLVELAADDYRIRSAAQRLKAERISQEMSKTVN